MTAGKGGSTAKVALFLPSLEGGGAEHVFVELANQFTVQGLTVDLVLASARGPYLGDVSSDVRIVDLEVSRVLSTLPGLVRYLRRERPAALLSALDHTNVVAIMACRLAWSGTRCVISTRSVPSEVYRRAETSGSQFLLRLMKAVYPFADAIVANSQAVAFDLSRLLRIPVDEIGVIHNPLNLARIERESRGPVTHDWLVADAAPIILAVGSLTPLKDYATLIRAFAIVRSRRDCRLAILGDGPERDKLAAVARQAGVAEHVLMPGFVPNPYVWMQRAAVFVSSSLTEGCPNALMQALALGAPIVSTDCVGGSAEILDGGRWGKLVPVGLPGAMAVAIGESLDAGAQPESCRRAADFSHDRIARRFLEVLLPGKFAADVEVR